MTEGNDLICYTDRMKSYVSFRSYIIILATECKNGLRVRETTPKTVACYNMMITQVCTDLAK